MLEAVWCLCLAEEVFADSSPESSMQFAPQHLKPCTAIARAFARRVLTPMPLVTDSGGREKRCTRHLFRLAGGWLGGFGLAWAPGTGSPCPTGWDSAPPHPFSGTDGHENRKWFVGRLRDSANTPRNRRRTGQPPQTPRDVLAFVRSPDQRCAAYHMHLGLAEDLQTSDPENHNHLRVLGVAQYRVESYEDALATLTRAEEMNTASGKGRHPADVAFLAMAHFQLGHIGESQVELASLRELIQDPLHAEDEEARGFLHEAETLIAGGLERTDEKE